MSKIDEKVEKYIGEGFLQKIKDFYDRMEGMPTKKEWNEIIKIIDSAKTFEDLAKAYVKDPSDFAGDMNAQLMEKARKLYKEYKEKGKNLPKGIEDAMEDANSKKGFGKLQRWFKKNA